MQERLLSAQLGSARPLGQAVLYFGCRRSDQDYLYGSQMEGWAKSGDLTLFTAFSRQQVRHCPFSSHPLGLPCVLANA